MFNFLELIEIKWFNYRNIIIFFQYFNYINISFSILAAILFNYTNFKNYYIAKKINNKSYTIEHI